MYLPPKRGRDMEAAGRACHDISYKNKGRVGRHRRSGPGSESNDRGGVSRNRVRERRWHTTALPHTFYTWAYVNKERDLCENEF